MKPQFKIDALYLFIFLLLCKLTGPLKNEPWLMITLPLWFFVLDKLISMPYNAIKRKLKSRKAKIEDKERWNQRMEELQRAHPKKPMKFNR